MESKTQTNGITLLPCPFCGGDASVRVLEYDDDCKVWGVFCESDLESEYSHGHFVDNYPTEAEAIAAWNTRTTLGNEREKELEMLVKQLWYLVNHRSGYGYAAALESIEELGIEVDE